MFDLFLPFNKKNVIRATNTRFNAPTIAPKYIRFLSDSICNKIEQYNIVLVCFNFF